MTKIHVTDIAAYLCAGFRARSLSRILLLLLISHTAPTALAQDRDNPDEQIVGKLDYWFVGHLGQKDDEGRLLVWEATVEGDLAGKMKWWFEIPRPVSPLNYTGGRATFYAARWEFWADETLLLAGESAGKTVFPDGADGVWDGHGRVTEGSGKFSDAAGRRVYETGLVLLGQDPPRTFSGTGLFVIH